MNNSFLRLLTIAAATVGCLSSLTACESMIVGHEKLFYHAAPDQDLTNSGSIAGSQIEGGWYAHLMSVDGKVIYGSLGGYGKEINPIFLKPGKRTLVLGSEVGEFDREALTVLEVKAGDQFIVRRKPRSEEGPDYVWIEEMQTGKHVTDKLYVQDVRGPTTTIPVFIPRR